MCPDRLRTDYRALRHWLRTGNSASHHLLRTSKLTLVFGCVQVSVCLVSLVAYIYRLAYLGLWLRIGYCALR